MIRINDFTCKTALKATAVLSAFLLFVAVASFGQQQINLTAAPTNTMMPDGTTVPMWGYFCGTAVSGSTATCAALNPASVANNSVNPPTPATWSPVVITVPTGATGGLQINLTNNLSFTPTGSASANTIPTSIVIVGQVGGGLGGVPTTTPSPTHTNAQGCPTWFIASGATPPGVPCPAPQNGASGAPPAQGPRIQSMGTEVKAGTTTPLTWPLLKPGTYLLESGTHPSIQVPMGLIGVLVVTNAPAGTTPGTAYPATSNSVAVPYNAEVPIEFSEIDPVQNREVDQAVRTAGFSETAVWTRMNAYGPITAVNVTSGGSGYTAVPSVTIAPPSTSGLSIDATATATATMDVSAIGVTSGGTGYASGDTVTISGGGGTGATATLTVVSGSITAVTVTSMGSGYTSLPTITINTTTGKSATFAPTLSVSAISLTNAGDGYTGLPQVSIAAPTQAGTTAAATAVLTLGGCAGSSTCYPPAVNYTPFYYLVNGVAFNKNAPAVSVFPATAGSSTTGITGTVLVRMVNAGLRMHTPSIVNSLTQGFNGAGAAATVSGFSLIAEDGNVLPNVAPLGASSVPAAPRVQTDVLMVPSKVYDALINVPAAPSAGAVTPALPVYARDLALSGNSSVRDAGMLAYISVNNSINSLGGALPAGLGIPLFAAAQANADTYNSLVAGQVLNVSDPSKGVIANDINVYGVALDATQPPKNGTLSCPLVGSPTTGNFICANGTFIYTPNSTTTTSDSFGYCANGTTEASPTPVCTTVALGKSNLQGNPVANGITYTSKMSTFLKIPSPGVLSVDSDPNSLPLTVAIPTVAASATSTGLVLNVDPKGGFTASVPGPGTYTFTYQAQNSQGALSGGSLTACNTTPLPAGCATVTLVFPQPSNLQVNVLDAQAYNNCHGDSTCIGGLAHFGDYRWIIEEDKTFWVDPNCTTNSSIATPGCPTVVSTSGQSTIPTFGVNFHTSNMDFVAQGCTGPLSCEGGQTMLDTDPKSSTFGTHIKAVCDVGNGACRPDPAGNGFTWVTPDKVVLDPAKRYYISVLPGDAASPFPAYLGQPVCPANGAEVTAGTGAQCGHTMSGAPIPPACNILGGPNGCNASSSFTQAVNVLVLPTPLPTGKLSVIVFEDDFPLNGEQDGGGGNGVVAPIEPGLGGFNIVLWDTYGGLGDVTGQNTYDDFNQPLSNSLAGTIDPGTGLDACPISATPLQATSGSGLVTGNGAGPAPLPGGMTGMIVTCPKYEADGYTLSPLAGQAVIANLMPEKFSVQAYPGADRIARGEQWLQTNTLDGQHPHDSFIRIGEPSYFQEYGPAGYHVAIGFANPAIINARLQDVCAGAGSPGAVGPCTNSIDGQVDVQRLSRTPDQRLYPSGSRDALTWTQCWVSLGDPDGEDFMFTQCDANGNFKFTGVPGGNWRLTIGDQWNDQIIDGLSTPANVGCVPVAPATTCSGGIAALHMGNIGVQQWQSNLYTKTCVDDNKNGICDPGEIGIPLIYTMIHYRDGHNSNSLTTDFNGIANFNETFPLFNWYVVEADATRYKTMGIHTVYDAGGPADGSTSCGNGTTARQCGTSPAYKFLANTYESVPLPADLSVPGAIYCVLADCSAEGSSNVNGILFGSTGSTSHQGNSTGRIDPPWVWSEGWSGMTSQGNWIEFAKAPFAACPPACATVTVTPPGATAPTTTQVAENGGIYGQVQYASTRPFEDASQMIQQPWEPYIPHVTVNLYQEGFAADGVTPTLTMVDTTQTSSWDDWAQGFYSTSAGSGTGVGQKPYMSCPGQGAATGTNADLFYYSLFDQPNYLDWYNSEHNGGTLHALPYNSQFKCYDAMHIWNQVQPAPYDGRYSFPSSLGIDPTTGKLLPTKGATNGVASSMAGTNCTICVANPDATDKWRVGTPMLPPGKYVVEVIMPPGYEVYKEEDKNLLIGDNYIAPVTQQFGGLGTDIFILPDQANVASMYDPNANGYNPNNFQDSTTSLSLQGGDLSGVPGFPGYTDPVWPCVGEQRVVPDFLSLFPQAQEVAPFAGATRPLCDRKEVTLTNQMSVRAKFALFTSTHIAAKYTGVITDDFTSEFDPFSPQFGEKFAPPNLPITTKDYLGNEISRVYSDHWGTYDGLTFSSWEVNPPNITGYSPSMMTQCMNDPGPILDTNPSSPTYGQMITDPLYNPAYSDFCYEEPYMPGLTAYLDTPVVPTQGFVGAGYNNPDCSYPDATPAIKEVDSSDGVGPWVSASGPGHTLTITALGNVQVNNQAYSGPSASVAPFSLKTVNRHYGFGAQCTAVGANCTAKSSVTIGGMSATITSWNDSQIVVTVPSGVAECPIQQQMQYQGTLPAGQSSPAQCGQLVITAGNGKQSIDAVTVTIGGKTPVHVSANQSVQAAIDQAAPGDLIIVDPTCTTIATSTAPSASAVCNAGALNSGVPTQTASPGSHTEMLLMWKPVRLQGVGAVSSVINANAFPAGKLLDPWRRHVNCLFGLTLQGVPVGSQIPNPQNPANPITAVYDQSQPPVYNCPDNSTNDTWNYFYGVTNDPQIDRMPLEATVGWDATLNGNLAEQLQEPSLMGAFEGATITVLAKGVDFHGANPWGNEAALPPGTTMLSGVASNPGGAPGTAGALSVGDNNSFCTDGTQGANRHPSNFICNPSSIDGLSVINSSQGGGGIFVHAWAHFLQIGNNRVYNNAGTLTGGISVGQGEFADPYIQGGTNNPPGSCSDGTGFVANQHLPNCYQVQVNVHNNYITNNSSLGDELFSGTLSGGGGVTFCTGNDYYKFNYNWVCGNLSSGEGGGLVHLGEIQNGDIEHNSFVFNQSQNPTIPTNGGGIQVMGTPDADPVCGTITDADCPPGLSDGTGHNLTINANLIQGNMSESGSGGGIRLQQINGTEVSTFPKQPSLWNSVNITNNIIVNNVAGWDGAGISLQDALNVNIVNNTIANNDTLASSGVLTQSIGTPVASAPAGSCVQNGPSGANTASCPQSAGITSTLNSTPLTDTFTGLTITCPPGKYAGSTANNGTCTHISYPAIYNDLIYQNRAFYVGVGSLGSGNQNQQNVVSLFYGSGTPAPNQTSTGQCSGGTIWDIGVRGDSGPGNHNSGFTLSPHFTMTTPSGNVVGGTNVFNAEYCNGSRVPPECSVADGCGGPGGYGVPPGIVDASTPNPVFSLTPSATVDEGNNWINVSWGPLSLTNPSIMGTDSNWGGGPMLGNYGPAPNSPAIDKIPTSEALPLGVTVPSTDFYGNPRPNIDGVDAGTLIDYGAVEVQAEATVVTPTLTSANPNSGYRGTSVSVTLTGTHLTGTSAVTVSGTGVTVSDIGIVSDTTVLATFTISGTAATGARTVTAVTPDGNATCACFVVLGPALTSINPTSGARGATNLGVTLTGIELNGATAVTVTGGGVTVGALTVSPDGTTLTTTFTISTNATTGARNVSVVTPNGTTNTVPFTVQGPTLTSISPTSGSRGTTVPVTFTGTNLNTATAVSLGGTGVTCSLVTPAPTPTTVNASCVISTSATESTRTATVTTAIGTATLANAFTVNGPTVTSISPTSGFRGTTVGVTVTGTNLSGASAVSLGGGGVTCTITGTPTGTSVTANCTISTTATVSTRNVTVTTATMGTSPNNPAVTFTVNGPTLTSVTPNSATHSTTSTVTVTLTFAGSNLSTVNGIGGFPSGVTLVAGSINATSTSVTLQVNIPSNVSTGTNPRNVYLTTSTVGNTNTVPFTIN